MFRLRLPLRRGRLRMLRAWLPAMPAAWAVSCSPVSVETIEQPPPSADKVGIHIRESDDEGPDVQVMDARTSVWEGRVLGTVLDADYATNHVIVDKGFGVVHLDWLFEVRRGGRDGKLVGLIRITRVAKGMSVAEVIEGAVPLQKGDVIISK